MSLPISAPFANESEGGTIGDLTFENRADHVALYGSLDIRPTTDGLAQLDLLIAQLTLVGDAIRAGVPGLPPPTFGIVDNPLA